jgi:hypothetical protein
MHQNFARVVKARTDREVGRHFISICIIDGKLEARGHLPDCDLSLPPPPQKGHQDGKAVTSPSEKGPKDSFEEFPRDNVILDLAQSYLTSSLVVKR